MTTAAVILNEVNGSIRIASFPFVIPYLIRNPAPKYLPVIAGGA